MILLTKHAFYFDVHSFKKYGENICTLLQNKCWGWSWDQILLDCEDLFLIKRIFFENLCFGVNRHAPEIINWHALGLILFKNRPLKAKTFPLEDNFHFLESIFKRSRRMSFKWCICIQVLNDLHLFTNQISQSYRAIQGWIHKFAGILNQVEPFCMIPCHGSK